MDRVKNYWKPMAAGLGVSLLGLFSYLCYKQLKGGLPFPFGRPSKEPLPLTKSEAMQRSNLLKNVRYTIFLQLRSENSIAVKNVYDGATLIEFDLVSVQNDLFFDFQGQIKKIVVNEEEIELRHSNERVYLPKAKLREQGNRVYIQYLNHYAGETRGIRHYIDPEDGNPYVYTQFEPFFAHFVFPCFDQPNIKAPIRLFVSCPNTWTVISSSDKKSTLLDNEAIRIREKEINDTVLQIPSIRNSFSLTEFEPTPQISPYTFALCAGTFAEIEDLLFDQSENLLPMKIYCRSSLQKLADNSFQIFQTAKEVKKWFRENLTTVPFLKTDFVFVPTLTNTAMENIGCITFDDKFLDPHLTPLEITKFHTLIAHELAHTFFGNFVTPEWWDDLWLKESFATFLSFLCLKQISDKLPDQMEQFNTVWLLSNKQKSKAITFDQYKTTHKIRDEVNDTSIAEVNYTHIVYYKGAAILKYFYYVIGHDLFFRGLKNYLIKFMDKSANYEQFKEILKSLSESSEISSPLDIIEPFLNNTGVVRLDSEIKTNLTHIEEFTITQSPCQFATPDTYYNFRMNILLIYEGKEVIVNDVNISNAHVNKVKELEKLEKPLAVVLNAGDWAYFKQTFTEGTKDYLISNAHRIKDASTRLVVARDFNEMIKEGKLDVESFIQFTVNLLTTEKEDFIIDQVIKTAINAATNFVLFEEQGKLKETLFELIREEIFHKHKHIRKSLVNYLIDLIDFANDKQIRYIIHLSQAEKTKFDLLRGESEILENVDLTRSLDISFMDESLKLRLLETIAESDVLTNDEKKHFEEVIRTFSDVKAETSLFTGRSLEKLTLEACKPIKSLKDKLYYMFVNKDADLLDEEYEAYMKGFARKSQYTLLKKYFKYKFFEDFAYVKNNWGEDYACKFFQHLNPSFVISERVRRSFIDLSKTIGNKENKLRTLVDKTISQMNINIKVAKKNRYASSNKNQK